uniref:glycosyl transferase family 90 n=2 Tax=Sphingobium yanoikuyae TaxID=13690 RepID=UPI0035B4AD52
MIRLTNVRREYPALHGRIKVLNDVSFLINPGEKVGVLGRNGAGKSTLIRILSGAERPDGGKVERTMTVSWPLAFGGAFQASLTGVDNLRFICRIYNKSWRDELDFVDDFTELGRFLREPVSTYSSGMASRLAFALSMVVDFDCFLIDEVMAVGDHRFHERCQHELFEKRGHKAMVFVSHDPGFIRQRCDRASVLKDGVLHNFDDLDHAFHYYYTEALPVQPIASSSEGASDAQRHDQETVEALLFGREVEGGEGLFGEAFAKWVFAHPLNDNPEVARYRLDRKVEASGIELLAKSFTSELSSDYSWRSVHSAMAAYAEERPACLHALNFLETFERHLPIGGDDGLWQRMSFEGGSIHRITTFDHKPSGRVLPIRIDFFRPATEDHVRNELAEFEMTPDGVVCTLQICHQLAYSVRLFASFPFLRSYFERCELEGSFALSLGDEGLNERVLSFCARAPDNLVVDPIFVETGGYLAQRGAYGEARPWADREDRAYWRGTDTGVFRYKDFTEAPRVVLAQMSNDHPYILDARLTQVERRAGWEYKETYYNENGLFGTSEPQDRILDFRYQIDVDGNTNSWSGLFLKLLSGAPVLKFESETGFKQWYYDELKPWENFVPVASDGSDLLERLCWLRENPMEAEAIGRRGRELALSITYDRAIEDAVRVIDRLVRTNALMS